MPLDPSIPLAGLRAEGGAQAPLNPFAMIGQWAQIQNAINQNRLFQQTFTAKQKAGQILAASPDIETGLAALSKDPETAAWAGEIGNSFRQNMLAMTQQQGEWQKQSETGLQGFMKMIPSIYADPSEENWNALADSALATTNPQIRDRVATAIGSLKKSLIDGLPDDPNLRGPAFARRLGGLAVASGLTQEGIQSIMGRKPKDLDLGDVVQPGSENIATGEFIPAGPAQKKGLPPTVSEVPGQGPVILREPSRTPLGTAMPGTSNPLMPGGAAPSPSSSNGLVPQPVQTAPLAPPSARPQAAASPSGVASPDSPLAGNGKPLFDPDALTMYMPKSSGTTAVGTPIRDPAVLENMKDLNQKFADAGHEYAMAGQGLGSIKYMMADLDAMAHAAKTNGMNLLAPGPWAGVRGQIANTINTIATITGHYDPTKPEGPDNKAPFDPKAIMSLEEFLKESERMKLMVTTSMLGTQREAGTTIANIGKSVPSIENSYMGGKLVIAGITAALQRQMDEQAFIQERVSRNPNGIIGAQAAFNKAFPASSYSDKVLSDFGLGKDGKFTGPDSVKRAFDNGLLDEKQARKILDDQFGIKGRK